LQLDFVNRELTVKLVYYGPALSGKTTNLQALHKTAEPGASGRLMTLETRDDRTLFFDLLPLTFRNQGSLAVRLKVFTVPGQVIHASTRRLVVQGADGITFIADSRSAETQHNAESFIDLKENLKQHGLTLKQMPVVIQFNKRDLPDVRTDAEIAALASRGREKVYKAIALRGTGVLETFYGLMEQTWLQLEKTHKLQDKFGLEPATLLRELRERLGVQPSRAEVAP